MKLSILMPTYNNKCYALVSTLCRQAEAVEGLEYEIIVADDGSRDRISVISNMLINELPHCRFVRRERNVGRAAIRNFLVGEAKGEWLLLVDSDISITHDWFLQRYIGAAKQGVVCGGIDLVPDDGRYGGNLRYRYEQAESHHHTAERRNQHPYKSFRTTGFMAHRSVFDVCRFDETFTRYGYEDVMFGIDLERGGIPILHISSPVTYTHMEDNATFLSKTEEAIRTLMEHRDKLQGYSPLLSAVERTRQCHLLWAVRLWHKALGWAERRNLQGNRPSLLLYKIYKIGAASVAYANL